MNTLFQEKQHTLRSPCKRCAGTLGSITTSNGQDVVRCASCDTYQYNAPKVETGREARTVSTIHEGIKTKQRARVLLRANHVCEICNQRKPLHVGHILSVKKGLSQGLTEVQLNSDENLAAMCDECNLGIGDQALPMWLCIGLLRARLRNDGNDVIPPEDVAKGN